jgi:hypothetical protein
VLYHLVRILQRLRGIDTELETEKET